MSTKKFLSVALVAAAGLASFGGGAGATVPDDDRDRLPEGIYRTREVSRDELIATGVAAGFNAIDVESFVDGQGIHNSTVMGLRLANGGWTMSVQYDGAPKEVAWRATYEVIDQNTVVATEPCGSVTFTYAVVGDQLTLDFIEDCAGAGDDETGSIAQTILSESAPFIRVAPDADSAESSTYSSTTFVVPFTVRLPDWVAPQPAVTESNFVTWEATSADRGIRFLAPVNLYPPGSTTATALPDDYVSYLLSQADHGATFSDVVETTVDGLPATIVTAAVEQSLDGGLGCQAEGMAAEDCFGLQPDLTLRLAVIDVGGQPLLIWVRDIRGVDAEYETFEAMLASLRFRESTDVSDQPTASVETTAP